MVPNANAPEEDEADSVGRTASLRGMNEYLCKHLANWVNDVRGLSVVRVCVCVCVWVCLCE